MENTGWLLLGFGVLALMQLSAILRSLQSTEAMMRRLLSHEGIEWGTAVEPSASVKELASSARTRVEAIRAYRQQTGLGVREAQAVVDGLARRPQGAS